MPMLGAVLCTGWRTLRSVLVWVIILWSTTVEICGLEHEELELGVEIGVWLSTASPGTAPGVLDMSYRNVGTVLSALL